MLRAAPFLLAVCALSLAASTGADPFVGTWKFNRAKSDLKAQTETIVPLGENRFRIVYSDVCSVRIGAACGSEIAFEIKADGSDQPFFPSSTRAMTIENENTWKIVYKTNGKIVAAETWTLSPDGRSLSRQSSSSVRRPDGSQISSDGVLKRLSGSTGFAGAWWIKDVSRSNPYEVSLKIEAPAEGVLVVSYPSMTITFGGQDFPVQGGNFPPAGSMASAKWIDSHSMRIIYKLGAKLLATTDWKVSADGKALRVREQDGSEKSAAVSVYERE